MGDVDPHLLGWMRLARCRGLGARAARALVDRCGAADLLADPDESLLARAGLPPSLRAALVQRRLSREVRRECAWARRHGWSSLHPDHPRYPPLLLESADPPLVLHTLGDLEWLELPAVALVGTRRPTRYGLEMAGSLAAGLAGRGLLVVSGLARGIDGEAHRAALEGGGGTVAVMGTGPGRIYPPEHRRLAERIAERGLLLTERPPRAAPHPGVFPRRNRIIVGLTRAVVVVEAAERSGSLITARLAAEEGREVLAVPGRAGEESAAGTLGLLRDGASLALCADDVIAQLPPGSGVEPLAGAESMTRAPAAPDRVPGTLDIDCRAILELLPLHDPLPLEQILDLAGRPQDEVLAALFALELEGWIEHLAGNAFARSRRGRQGLC